MKRFLVFASLLWGVAAFAQTPLLAPTSTFNWKLHLRKGQTWTQTIQTQTRSGGSSGDRRGIPFELIATRTITLQNEVLEETATGSRVRTTFGNFDYTSKSLPEKLFNPSPPPSSLLLPALVGGSFTWKQEPNGHVVGVQGMEDLIARQQEAVKSLAQTPIERKSLASSVFPFEELRAFLVGLQTVAVPAAPLSIGDNYAYAFPFSIGWAGRVESKRTLRSFDGQSAILDEDANFERRSRVDYSGTLSSTRSKPVILTRDAAQLYLMRTHRVSPTATRAYLSKTGRIYYRNAQHPNQIIWIDPPQGIWLVLRDALAYRAMIGYNDSKNGMTLREALDKNNFDFVPPVNVPFLVKFFVVTRAATSGQTTVSSSTGLVSQSQIVTRVHGRTTVINKEGKEITPLWSSVETTISSQIGKEVAVPLPEPQ